MQLKNQHTSTVNICKGGNIYSVFILQGIFPPSMIAFAGMKREDQSSSSPPPPPETNPLNGKSFSNQAEKKQRAHFFHSSELNLSLSIWDNLPSTIIWCAAALSGVFPVRGVNCLPPSRPNGFNSVPEWDERGARVGSCERVRNNRQFRYF